MFKINFSVGSRFIVNRKKIRKQVEASFGKHRIENGEVNVSIVGNRRMKELNEGLMKHEGTTDVLSFSQRDPSEGNLFPSTPDQLPHFGDVVVCYPVAVHEAAKKGKMVDDMINFYVDHSIQHLLGFHHE